MKIKYKLILLSVINILLIITMSGCSFSEHDLSDNVQFVTDNEKLLRNVEETATRIMSDDWDYITIDIDEKHLTVRNMDVVEDLDMNEPAVKFLAQFMKKYDCYSIRNTENGLEMGINTGINGHIFGVTDIILFSNKSLDELGCPVQMSYDGDDRFEPVTLEWEKHQEGDTVVYESDHRDDDATWFQGMYYRVDITKATNGIYVYCLTEDYPFIEGIMSV